MDNYPKNGAQTPTTTRSSAHISKPAQNAHAANGSAPLWFSTHPDEVRFCQLLANSGRPEKVFAVGLRPRDFADKKAVHIFEAALSVYANGSQVTPDAIAAECEQRAEESDQQGDFEAWQDAALIASNELTRLPRNFPNQAIPSDEAAKMAAKIVAKRGKRTRRDEPTPDEIKATAEAVEAEAGAATFPELRADQIPAPALQIGEKHEYDPHQLRVLLRPQGTCVSLETEAAHAERAAQFIGDNFVFVPELGPRHYDERAGFWRGDDKGYTLTAAKLKALAPTVRAEAAALLRYAATLAAAGRDSDAKAMSRAANSLLSHAKQIEKQSFLAGAAKFLFAERRAEVEQFAPVAWKFAFKNCVFDKGQWRAARRDDFLLHVSPVEMNSRADRREWCALLNRITGGDEDFARTLQDAAAYVVSGASSLRLILWFFGGKGTGKSTICELLQTLLGEAAATIDTALLQDSSSRERLGAQLVFKRGAFVSEAGNKRIEAELLKTLSGGDRLSVRFLYLEAFTAKPTHALVLAANDAPITDANDDALKDRVMALPFVHPLGEGEPLQFEGHRRVETARQDPNSPLLRGFAAWVAEGLERLYQSQEIYRAPAVRTATAKFWADTDELTPFWETIEEDELRAGIANGELRGRYEAWCDAEKMRPVRGKTWARACDSHKLKQERIGPNRIRTWFYSPGKTQKDQKDQNNGLFQKGDRVKVLDIEDFRENTPYSGLSGQNEQNTALLGDEPGGVQ